MDRSRTPRVSIVIATFQRLPRLQSCIQAVRSNTAISRELIVVDGRSTDGTGEWLAAQPDIRTHIEQVRSGCCRAYDTGLRMAVGRYVMWLNDDAQPLPDAIDAAVHFIERPESRDVGLVAFYHTHRQPWNELHGVDRDGRRFGVLHVRGFPYANFGLLRRELLESLGYLDTGYHFCAWDPDLSLMVQRLAGLKVVGAPDALIDHEEYVDDRKRDDAGQTRTRDNERLFAKWSLPRKGPFADRRSAYRQLLARYATLPACQCS
jgi:GT2 family glycosyltransferase